MDAGRIVLTLDGAHSRVLVDGHDISRAVTGVNVHARARGVPRVTLSVLAHAVEVEGVAELQLPAHTRAALIELGWTPPAEPAEVES